MFGVKPRETLLDDPQPKKVAKVAATLSASTTRALESVQGKPADARGSRATADERSAVCQALATVSTPEEGVLAFCAPEELGYRKSAVYLRKQQYDAAQANLEGGQLTADVFVRKLGRRRCIDEAAVTRAKFVEKVAAESGGDSRSAESARIFESSKKVALTGAARRRRAGF